MSDSQYAWVPLSRDFLEVSSAFRRQQQRQQQQRQQQKQIEALFRNCAFALAFSLALTGPCAYSPLGISFRLCFADNDFSPLRQFSVV